MSEPRIALSDLSYGPEEEAALVRVVRSRWLTTGPEVDRFESEFAAFVGARHAIAVSSGTAALHLALMALGVGGGKAVVQPALNFVAAANVTRLVGATPRFVDIVGPDDPTLDPVAVIEAAEGAVGAVIVMHYGGYLCRIAEIVEICRERGIPVVEDACHAVGARYTDPRRGSLDGRMAGTLGDIGCFSFFSNKNLAVGEGGMVVTDDDGLAAAVRSLRSHGMTTLTWQRHRGHASSYDVIASGLNYRSDELRAALGRVQLQKLPGGNARRAALADRYRSELKDLSGWDVPFANYVGDSANHLMVALAPDQARRDRAAAVLREAGIQSSLHYPPIPSFAAFRDFASSVPRTDSFSARAISLPLHAGLGDEQVAEVCALIRSSSAGAR